MTEKSSAAAASAAALAAASTSAAGTSNPVVLENQKAGNPQSEWDISLPGSTNIEGFATSISVNRGNQIDFKINTDSANYRIDIYRLGYYGGLGARLAKTIQQTTATQQPTPGGDPSIGLLDAGNWQVSASWVVPVDAVSGVYIAKLVRQDGVAGENHIPFIVRDDSSSRDIVFQTSDTTWHAYNGYVYHASDGSTLGGTNFYGGNATASNDGRAYKVSYNRPIATRGGVGTFAGPQDFLFCAEYPAIRWLEQNGYDVCYIAGVDTGPGNAQLQNFKVFMSVGHDEYWSGDQRAHVETARDQHGVNLIFISGNEVYWKTRWEPDSNGTPNRTLVTYKETHAVAKIDPSPEWTGTWRDPSFSPPSDGGRPENGLTGTLFQVDSFRGDAITIPFSLSRLWFWRNTSVANLPPGPPASLASGILGYEWDESPDNGFRPEGLIHLSATTLPVNTYLLDYGNAVGPATATHNLSLYRAPSGAIVFGAGTVFWAWGLDDNHDYVNDDPSAEPLTPVDPNVQQATVNLLADMGVQPGTLQAGLVPATQSADHTPPVSTITTPSAGASVVQQQMVTISGTASDTSGLVAAVEVSTDGGTTWHAATGTTSWTYSWWPLLPGTYTIKSAAVDDSLNREIPGAGVAVTVTPAGTVSLFTPGDAPFAVLALDDNAVELGVKFQVNIGGTVTGIRFYKDPENTGTHIGHLWSAAGQLLGTATFANETASGWQQSDLTPPTTLTAGASYVASYHTIGFYSADTNYFRAARTCGAISALASGTSGGNGVYAYGANGAFPGNSFLNSNYWVDVVFNRTGGAGDLPPTANNDSGLTTAQNTALSIPASALLANDTDPNGYPLAILSVGNPNNGTVAYNPATLAVSFTPTPGYIGSASFTYTITNGHGGNASASVSLTVGASTATQSLFSTGDTPATVTVNDPNAVELGVKFETTVSGHVTGARFYKGPQNTGTHAANLWDAAGTLLANATFTNETASGWQTVDFPQPVAVVANTIYIASYHTNGFYSANSNYFATAHSSGALTAPTSTPSGGNGVYAYGSAGSFPAGTFNATNYWVDVMFQS